MYTLKFKSLVIIALMLLPSLCFGESRIVPILQFIDENYKMKKDIKANVLLTQQKPDQGTKIIEMKLLPPGF